MQYLDGNYFIPALSQIDVNNLIEPEPFLVEVRDKARFTKVHDLTSNNEDFIVRLIIETYNQDDVLIGRHSNLLIIRTNERIVYRFEPLDDWIDLPLSDLFPGYEVLIEDYHPQSKQGKDDFWCNAYIIERASAYIQDREPNDIDGESYAKAVTGLFEPLPGPPDVEFGPPRRVARRTARRTTRRVVRRS